WPNRPPIVRGMSSMRRSLPLVGGLVSVIKRRFGGPHNREAPPEAAGGHSAPPRPQVQAAQAAAGGPSMREPTTESILDALRGVTDPERGGDVVSLGMISGVVIKNGNVGFAVEVSPSDGIRKEPLRKACEKAVEAVPGVLSVTAVLTAERQPPAAAAAPPQQQPGSTGHTHAPGRSGRGSTQQRLDLPNVRAIVAVASGKGGVGKSTTAVNLALGLAALGRRVGILDADVFGPSMPRMLGAVGRPETTPGQKLRPMEAWGIVAMSMGFLVAEETPMIWRG